MTDDAAPLPSLDELLSTARVVALPLVTRFRGIDVREAMLFEGPEGWTEFSPFVEYDDDEASAWLAAAIDYGWNAPPPALRDRIPVNATVPAVDPDSVRAVLARFPGCRTAKVKVASADGTLGGGCRARARRARGARPRGPHPRRRERRLERRRGRARDPRARAVRPRVRGAAVRDDRPSSPRSACASKYMGIPIAADESVRRAEDPLAVAESARPTCS